MDGRRWKASVAGLPCTIELDEWGDWVVTIASSTVGRRRNLADAIADAGGGVVARDEAEALAASIEARREREGSPPRPTQGRRA